MNSRTALITFVLVTGGLVRFSGVLLPWRARARAAVPKR